MTALNSERTARRTQPDTLAPGDDRLAAAAAERALDARRAQLWTQRDELAAAAAAHLGLGWRDGCRVQAAAQWSCSPTHVSVAVEVRRGAKTLAPPAEAPLELYLMRVPLATDGDAGDAGDAQVLRDAGTAAWLARALADADTGVCTPHVAGFGLAKGARFTHVRHLPLATRVWHWVATALRRAWWRSDACIDYRATRPDPAFSSPLSHVLVAPVAGTRLAASWADDVRQQPASDHQHVRRHNLYAGLARLVLALARLPQPRLGAFVLDPDRGTVRVAHAAHDHADTYARAQLARHDAQFRADPSAVLDADDARQRMAVRSLWRVVAPHFTADANTADAIFLPQLDVSLDNVVVDDEWHVTGIAETGSLHVAPASALAVPSWLAGSAPDDHDGPRPAESDAARRAFVGVVRAQRTDNAATIADTLEAAWATRAVWFWAALRAPSHAAAHDLFARHLLPHYAPGHTLASIASAAAFWAPDAEAIVRQKTADRVQYCAQVHVLSDTNRP